MSGMTTSPGFHELNKVAVGRGQRLMSRVIDGQRLYAIVNPDHNGKGTDPDGRKAAEHAFGHGLGMTLEEAAEALGY